MPDVPALTRPGETRTFDYRVPPRLAGEVAVGSRVRVRLHGRPVGGWVVALDVEPPAGVALQPLTAHSGLGPPAELLALATWAAWRWAGPVSSFLATASPPQNVRSLPRVPAFTPPPAEPGWSGERWDAGGQLVVLPPAADPLGLVLSVLAGCGPQTLVMVPSVGWAARLSGRLAARGVAVAADWAEAAAGWPMVVGARAAAWSPLPSMSAAVVVDAHDAAYRDERSPTADAVEVVAERARRLGVPCVLVSPCPTAVQVATYRRRHDVGPPGGAHAAHGGWPRIAVVDRRRADPRSGLYSDELVRLATARPSSPGSPLVCVLNRTGRARLLACASCGELARCRRCARPLRQDGDELVCPACADPRPAVCDACGATRLKALRVGVTRVREELEALLGVPVAEVSGPAPPTAEMPGAAVVVGTEAVLHRLRRASAVAFLDFDQHLLAARFAAAEEASALLVRAGRLVGGRDRPGTGPVLVQTRLPDHEVLVAAVRGEPMAVVDAELEVRRALRLPPAAALATVAGAGAADLAAATAVLGVETSPLPDGRWLLRAADHVVLCDALAAAPRPAGRLRVAVDPTDL
ncbi:MAG: primosomal protein N' family DNA-binding protein [Acidimicrobiales bacterium]